jgi:hypothetical protein
MAMKKLLLLWVATLISLVGYAQVDYTDSINAIKRDTAYIYAESTMKDPVEAQSGAHSVLELKVTDWVRSKWPRESAEQYVAKTNEIFESMVTMRGNYTRVFVYVKKSRLVPSLELEEAVREGGKAVQELAQTSDLTSEEEEMAAIFAFDDIKGYISDLNKDHLLLAYGKYMSLPVEAPCYIFVYNQEAEVIAVLRQTEDGKHFNLRTRTDDNIKNYKNCGAIWFQLK